MRASTFALVTWAASAAVLAAPRAELIANATELRESLIAGHRVAPLEEASVERGCRPTGCTLGVDGLVIHRESGTLSDAQGRPIRLVAHPAGAEDPPKMDSEPLAAYTVRIRDTKWGTCLEFAHIGLGGSGTFQRWSSVVLAPLRHGTPAPVAHRFIGYWASCDALVEGTRPGQVLLPVIQRGAQVSRLQWTWMACTAHRCERRVERSVVVVPSSGGEGGALTMLRTR